MEKDYAENTWGLLKRAIKEIHKQNASGLSFEELYRNAYNLVLHKYGDMLYGGVRQVVDEHLKAQCETVADRADDRDFLSALERIWKDHSLSTLMIRDILMYMDRVYVSTKNLLSVFDLGLQLFGDNITRNPRVQHRLLNTLLDMIHRERTGEVIERHVIKACTQMYIQVGIKKRTVYETEFENHFLERSREFYKGEAQEFINSNSCSDYMIKAEQRLAEEAKRVENYLDADTGPKIREVVEQELIEKHMITLLEMERSGIVSMLRDDKLDDLRRMYTLFGRVKEGHQTMRTYLTNYIRETGESLVRDKERDAGDDDKPSKTAAAADSKADGDDKKKRRKEKGKDEEEKGKRAKDADEGEGEDEEDGEGKKKGNKPNPQAFVQGLLDLKEKYDRLLKGAFGGDKKFQTAINKAFDHFINLNPRAPEYLSLFIDHQLKKGLKGVSEGDVDATLDKAMMLFRHINEKDVFEKYYKQHLARRLLNSRSVSDDAERNMIQKLKTECGYQFTCKLEGMFTDMRVSADTMKSFRQFLRDNPEVATPTEGIEMSVSVLTTGFWPTQSGGNCVMPNVILKCEEIFKRYYLSQHSGRRLTWQAGAGTCELKAEFPKGKHELIVTTQQMAILMLFNDNDLLSYKDLLSATNQQATELKRNLQSLACGKLEHRVLTKEPKGKTIEESDKFCYNASFTSKLFRVKIPTVVKGGGADTDPQAAETKKKVDEDRKHHIEAAVVRIMKSRKTLEHNQLIAEVTQQLSSRFVPSPVLIKKRIESLIEREYLERAKSDRRLYNYLA